MRFGTALSNEKKPQINPPFPLVPRPFSFRIPQLRIPIDTGHSFRFNPDTCSEGGRTPIPVNPDTG
jgi:hypothetical protein